MRFDAVVAPYNSIAYAANLDVFAPGAFTQSIAEKGGRFPLITDHNPASPIGFILVQERHDGLYGVGTILPTAAGRDESVLVKAGVRKAISIGFACLASRPAEFAGK